ncbi:UNVERIFIED_CONTAM: hypothetical protein K2H54_034545 [Gekko kuhli]
MDSPVHFVSATDSLCSLGQVALIFSLAPFVPASRELYQMLPCKGIVGSECKIGQDSPRLCDAATFSSETHTGVAKRVPIGGVHCCVQTAQLRRNCCCMKGLYVISLGHLRSASHP